MPKKKPTKIDDKEAREIIVKGARTHNLKNISVTMPRNKMIAITGLSGSGKSSLAFDTIFAEGQRRYVESLSAYARQFLNQMPKPDVDEITGLSPAISIDQKTAPRNPRSTVATITEVYDYLRVLFARIGRPYSPTTGHEIKKMSNEEISRFVISKVAEFEKTSKKSTTKKELMGVRWDESALQIYAPIVRGRKGEYYQMLYDLLNKGFSYVRIDGEIYNLRDKIELSKNKKHDIDLLIDEFAVHELHDDEKDFNMRLAEAVERAVDESEGLVRIVFGQSIHDRDTVEPLDDILLSAKLISPEDGFSFPEIEPRLFSFNSPYGACPHCNGLGTHHLFGNENDDICEVCQGGRLRQEAFHVLLGSTKQAEKYVDLLENSQMSVPENPHEGKSFKRKGINIFEFTQLPIVEAHEFVLELELSKQEEEIAGILLNEIESRLQFLINVGLQYLTLNRRANTLSGGEAQRIRLASQLGSKLVGAMYVLDEPTIGLHQRDNDRLIDTLTDLRNLGNTIIVVEHDEDTVRAADYIIDIGPAAGVHGGEVVAMGYLDELLEQKSTKKDKSLTLEYLRGEQTIEVPKQRRTKDKGIVKVRGGKIHNITDLKVDIPLGRLVCITGVSGSGKSSFMYEVLHRNLQANYDRRYRSAKVFNANTFEGHESLSRVILVDQSPIGRTPRSNPATYTGAWNFIREIFASTDEARLRGWKPGRFSFNVKGGRCEACEGRGVIPVEMHFLPTVYVTCDVCNGTRFEKETLQVKYKHKSIHDVLQMTIEDAAEFFKDIPAIYDRFATLIETGLGYLQVGQPANTLSGGESQRVKIASELYRPMTQKTIYLLDEPTVGLHFEDVRKLIEILNKLVDRGNSVVLIEHNLDVVKSCDYLLDMGPEGGSGGGQLVAKGTPEEVAKSPDSWTGKYLRKVL
jgi:excinuclease ABC subunit A